jgi:hypothetical protein
MQYLHEPITIILQMKAIKTNQFNQLRQFMKKIDPQASLNLKTQNPSLQKLAQSSTFFLKSSSLRLLASLIQKDSIKDNGFFEFDKSKIVILGGFYQNQQLDFYQLRNVLDFNASKMSVLGSLSKRPRFLLFYGQLLSRMFSILKANNGN